MPALKRSYSCDLIQEKFDEQVLFPVAKRRRRNQTLPICHTKPATISMMPYELLREIFVLAIPPEVFLDPFLGRGPNSAWCQATQTKRAIVLVCKFWYDIALDLLYKRGTFRRLGQMGHFVAALTNNPRLPPLVESIHVASHLLGPYDTALNQLFRLCPNIHHLAVGMGPVEGLHYRLRQTRFPHPDAGVGKVSRLEILDNSCLENFLSHMKSFSNLKSLVVALDTQDLPADLEEAHYVIFHHLEDLHISVNSESDWDCEALQILLKLWIFPRLRHLSILQSNSSTLVLPAYHKLLEVYGQNLKTLSFAVTRRAYSQPLPLLSTSDVQLLVDYCPQLEHLVLPTIVIQDPPLSHASLRWVDIWAAEHGPTSDAVSMQALFRSTNFPSLKSVRLLDWALLSVSGPQLPMFIPPHAVESGYSLEWKFPGMHIQHDFGHLYQRDMDYVDACLEHCTSHVDMDLESDPAEMASHCRGGDSDPDEDGDSTPRFRSVSPSYSAYDSEEGDLEVMETEYDESFSDCLHNRDIFDRDTIYSFEGDVRVLLENWWSWVGNEDEDSSDSSDSEDSQDEVTI
ncbi:hypothetical protein F5I97DRAFT_1876296 [Phlebopus sp. FC_14]|nr:hypothetical protein F5I97DRAFT_1876296 [Phlebopus sp. FC_14]